ncbi:MAG: hypothetical protein QN716_01585 [Nitrososphaeraceae archaeon]|nr:hypothetical protein [Nitrososphaeraceae archaeon]
MEIFIESENGREVFVHVDRWSREDGTYEFSEIVIDGLVWHFSEMSKYSKWRITQWIDAQVDVWEKISEWIEDANVHHYMSFLD